MSYQNIENRLIKFAVEAIEIGSHFKHRKPGYHLADQLARSTSSAALNYAEARGASSKRDFVHKMRIVLKELRESHVCLIIIKNGKLLRDEEKLEGAIVEANELVSIFVSSHKKLAGKR